jgi:hypothetical protein
LTSFSASKVASDVSGSRMISTSFIAELCQF